MKILVRGANWIGDSVMTVPALRALRRAFTNDEITLHTRSWAEGIFRDADFVDRILFYDRPESSLNEVISQSRVLRAERFDLAVIFPGSFASALGARFAGIPRRFGYSKEARRLFLTDPVTPPKWKSRRHEVFYYLNLVQEVERSVLGTQSPSDNEPSTELTISQTRRNEARDFLGRKGVDLSRPLVAIGAGSTNSTAKRWPAKHYSELINKLHVEVGANIVMVGGRDDIEVGRVISESVQCKTLDLTGKTSLGDAAAILSVCDLMISNDMGLAHLAPAVGTKTIVIFGPTDPVTTRPFSPLAEVIRVGVECSPCMLRECPIDHRCMTRISHEQVFESAVSKLESYDQQNSTAAGHFHRP
jgi:heptosyltransferase-2